MFRRMLLWLVVTMIMAAMVLATAVPALAAKPVWLIVPGSGPTPEYYSTAKECQDIRDRDLGEKCRAYRLE